GPNRTVQRIILESSLVRNYKTVHSVVERNFHLTSRTIAHAEPKMDRTFATLLASLEKRSIHEFKPGRKSFYSIPDIMDKGL
ncbi:hypothetical protein M378DRAFT_41312, partial [Amanita muscaria Koide BX008]